MWHLRSQGRGLSTFLNSSDGLVGTDSSITCEQIGILEFVFLCLPLLEDSFDDSSEVFFDIKVAYFAILWSATYSC